MKRKTFSREELLYLTASEEFQKLFAGDRILDQLEAERFDEHLEFNLTMETLGQVFQIGTFAVSGITAALWALLWSIGSAYAVGGKEAAEADADVFLWLLANRLTKPFDLHSLPGVASGSCAAAGLTFEEAHAELLELVAMAFAPLALLPPSRCSGEKPRFDSDWLCWIAGIAARESGETARYCMHEMPLSVCFRHYINLLRRDDYKNTIRRRPDAEICEAMLARTDELCEEFLKVRRQESKKK